MLLNGGPLSEIRISGIPWTANILCNVGITADTFVECTISTSGNRVYLSITTCTLLFGEVHKSQHVTFAIWLFRHTCGCYGFRWVWSSHCLTGKAMVNGALHPIIYLGKRDFLSDKAFCLVYAKMCLMS